MPQRGQVLRAGAPSFQAPARWLRLFIFDFFFFGTATAVSRHLKRAAPGYRPIPAEEPASRRATPDRRAEGPRAPTSADRAPRASQSHAVVLRSTPHCGQIPAQSGRHSGCSGRSSTTYSRTTGARSIWSPTIATASSWRGSCWNSSSTTDTDTPSTSTRQRRHCPCHGVGPCRGRRRRRRSTWQSRSTVMSPATRSSSIPSSGGTWARSWPRPGWRSSSAR